MPPLGKSTVNDVALQHAHSAFHATACQRLKSLQASGLEAAAAGSRLMDDLIEQHQEAPNRAAAATTSSSNPSVQHVVSAIPGASVADASKVLMLRDEIGRLRREGLSTVKVIEQLRERLRDGDDAQAGWDENGSISAASSWRPSSSTTSKKRRVSTDALAAQWSDEAPGESPREGFRPSHTPSAISIANVMGPLDPSRHALVSHLSPLPPEFGTRNPFLSEVDADGRPSACPADGKRVREDAAPLAQLTQKKLKLRSQAES